MSYELRVMSDELRVMSDELRVMSDELRLDFKNDGETDEGSAWFPFVLSR